MSKNKQGNILGQSGNFHRKIYKELYEKGLLNKEMGEAEQKRVLDNHYRNLGYEAKDFELTQIYNLGATKIKNIEAKEKGKRDVLSKKEKKIQKDLEKNEKLAARNKTGKQSFRNNNRSFNKKYERWKADNGYDSDRNNPEEVNIINEYLGYLKNDKGYKDSTINNYRQAIHTEQEDIFRKAIKQQKQQVKFERHFTKITKNRRLPINVSPENMDKFIKLSNHSNNLFDSMRTTNRQGDVKKFQQELVLDAYMAEYKGYSDHNQIKIEDIEDYFKWLKSDKEVDGKIIEGLSNKTCGGYKTSLNQYSLKGDWTIGEEVNKISVQDFGVGKVHKKVVQRAMSMEEVDKMLTLAFEGTTTHKANPNFFVGYSLLMELGAGLRSDEDINLTLKQIKDMLKENEAILELVKTKGNVPRQVEDEVLKFMDVFLNPCQNLIKASEKAGLRDSDKPLIDLFPKNKERAKNHKTHLIKGERNAWFRNHRDKFQDEDRMSNREITRENDKIEKKSDVEIKKGDLTPHACRHTFASTLFQAYKESTKEQFNNDYNFRKELYQTYKKERTRDNRKFNPNPNKMDYYIERGYHMYLALQVSELLGHGRYEITENYIVTKDSNNKLIAFDLKSFREFELGVDNNGNFYATKRND